MIALHRNRLEEIVTRNTWQDVLENLARVCEEKMYMATDDTEAVLQWGQRAASVRWIIETPTHERKK